MIGLLHEVHRTPLDCIDGHADIAVPADEHDRDTRLHLDESCLQGAPAHAGHPNVEHEATGAGWVEGIEIRLRRVERLGCEPHRQDQLADGVAHSPVVIDDEDGRVEHGVMPHQRREA